MSQETTVTCSGCGRTKKTTLSDGVPTPSAGPSPSLAWIDYASVQLVGGNWWGYAVCSKPCQATVLRRIATELDAEAKRDEACARERL